MAKSIIHAAGAKHGVMHPNKTGSLMEGAAAKAQHENAGKVERVHASHPRRGAKGMHLKHSA